MSEQYTDTVVERLRNAAAWATDAGHVHASNVRVEDLTRLLDRLATFDDAYNRRGDRLAEMQAQRDELRAILAPLLDEPCRYRVNECVFCHRFLAWDDAGHADDCPTLPVRRDALLGRADA